jgi:hypothetical protein
MIKVDLVQKGTYYRLPDIWPGLWTGLTPLGGLDTTGGRKDHA